MASLATALANVRTALTALSLTTEWGSDRRDDLNDPLAAGGYAYQIVQQYEQRTTGRSNVQHEGGAIEIVIYHRLADPTDERAYTEGNMHTLQSAVLAFSWWEDLAAIQALIPGGEPRIEQDVDRDGNVIKWSVLAAFQLVP